MRFRFLIPGRDNSSSEITGFANSRAVEGGVARDEAEQFVGE